MTSTRFLVGVRRAGLAGLLVAAVAAVIPAGAAHAAAAKSGARCTRAGAKSGNLVCTRRSGQLVWARAATTTTRAKAATTKAATASSAAPTTAAAGAAAGVVTNSTAQGIEGQWKATAESIVGYRVKEVLFGQSTEAYGRTSSVTGTLQIAGTTATAAEFSVDMRTIRSDDNRRDGQFQGRIMSTSQFPTATLTLLDPIAFAKVPADREVLDAKAKADLTLRGTKRTVEFDLKARRNGANLEINGQIPVVFADYGIGNPSAPGITTEDNGVLEFLIVLGR